MSPTRSTKPAPKPTVRKTEAELRAKYASMLIAVAQLYPHTPRPLLTAVLAASGANPKIVPRSMPFDEHGYYHMDHQLQRRWKNPWPSDEARDDAFLALEIEGEDND